MSVVFARSSSGQAAQPIALAGGYWDLIGTLTFTNTVQYAAGGDPLDLTPFFPAGKTIRECVVLSPIRGFEGEYDVVNKKLKLWGFNPAAATLDVAMLEHPATVNYIAALTATPVPAIFRLKG